MRTSLFALLVLFCMTTIAQDKPILISKDKLIARVAELEKRMNERQAKVMPQDPEWKELFVAWQVYVTVLRDSSLAPSDTTRTGLNKFKPKQ